MSDLRDWQRGEREATDPLWAVRFTEAEFVELQEVVGALDEDEYPWSQAVYAKLGVALVNLRKRKAATPSR